LSRPAPKRSPAGAGRTADTGQPPLVGYEVLVCVCGGIAAFKIAALVSELTQLGCGVSVAMTRHARRFVGPTTFQALTGRPVATSLWSKTGEISHLSLTAAADLVVVAPATANIIGKLAHGIADDLVSTLLLGVDSPVLLAPAMNVRMWEHASVQRNAAWLRDAGILFVGPEKGRLACGTTGRGRMSEPEALLDAIRKQLLRRSPKCRPADDA
jgi:phosphopantothenoylcysteine decarboxylase/phosphopantothenate--cysteine ligase